MIPFAIRGKMRKHNLNNIPIILYYFVRNHDCYPVDKCPASRMFVTYDACDIVVDPANGPTYSKGCTVRVRLFE